MKTGFRAKDAKNAKKLLQGELVEFVYESLDVTFEEPFSETELARKNHTRAKKVAKFTA